MTTKLFTLIVLITTGGTALASDLASNSVVRIKPPPENPAFKNRDISGLRSELEKNNALVGSGHENHGMVRKLRVELAKRGDGAERNRIFTALHSTNLIQQAYALEDASLIGDAEAVCRLAEILNDPSPGGRISSDEAVMPPRLVAAMKLSELIEPSPVLPIGPDKKFYTEADVAKWQVWWETNRVRFQPAGK